MEFDLVSKRPLVVGEKNQIQLVLKDAPEFHAFQFEGRINTPDNFVISSVNNHKQPVWVASEAWGNSSIEVQNRVELDSGKLGFTRSVLDKVEPLAGDVVLGYLEVVPRRRGSLSFSVTSVQLRDPGGKLLIPEINHPAYTLPVYKHLAAVPPASTYEVVWLYLGLFLAFIIIAVRAFRLIRSVNSYA